MGSAADLQYLGGQVEHPGGSGPVDAGAKKAARQLRRERRSTCSIFQRADRHGGHRRCPLSLAGQGAGGFEESSRRLVPVWPGEGFADLCLKGGAHGRILDPESQRHEPRLFIVGIQTR